MISYRNWEESSHLHINVSHQKEQLWNEIFTYHKRKKKNSLKPYCLVEVKKWLNKNGMQALLKYTYCKKKKKLQMWPNCHLIFNQLGTQLITEVKRKSFALAYIAGLKLVASKL